MSPLSLCTTIKGLSHGVSSLETTSIISFSSSDLSSRTSFSRQLNGVLRSGCATGETD